MHTDIIIKETAKPNSYLKNDLEVSSTATRIHVYYIQKLNSTNYCSKGIKTNKIHSIFH